jgi:hypothetical protein
MQKFVKSFRHKFSFVVGSQGFDLHVGLILHQGLVCLEFVKTPLLSLSKGKHDFFFEKLSMKVTKYHAPPRDVVCIDPHTSLCTSSKSLEALVGSSLGKDVL